MHNANFPDKCYDIIGACMNVHNELGYGFLESVYQEALKLELSLLKIPFEKEVKLEVSYKGTALRQYYLADFICFGDIIVELKAVKKIEPSHKAQVINYLKATRFKQALLINFGSNSLQHEKINNLDN